MYNVLIDGVVVQKTQAEMATKLSDNVKELIRDNLLEMLQDPKDHVLLMGLRDNLMPALKHSFELKMIINDILLDSPEEIRQSIFNLQERENAVHEDP